MPSTASRNLPALVACMILAATTAFADTAVQFVASEPSPVFRITSIYVETSGLALTSDVTEVIKKMELLTLAPSSLVLTDGDYLLNWGGTEDFNRTFVLKADGSPKRVVLSGSRTLALWSLAAAGAGTVATLVSVPFVRNDQPSTWATALVSGALAATGLVGLLVFSPRVEVQ